MRIRWVQAHDSQDCGAACLATICEHYGFRADVGAIAAMASVNRQGARLDKIRDAALSLGFDASSGKARTGAFESLPLPCILHLQRPGGGHYVVMYKLDPESALIADPSIGVTTVERSSLMNDFTGFVVLLRPGSSFPRATISVQRKSTLSIVSALIQDNKKSFALACAAGSFAAATSLAVPLLVGAIIDHKSVLLRRWFGSYWSIAVMLLSIALSRAVFTFMRTTYTAQFSSNIERSLLQRFSSRLVSASLSYFDCWYPGDIVGRVTDAMTLRSILAGPILTLQIDIAYLVAASILIAQMSLSLLTVTIACAALAFLFQASLRPKALMYMRLQRMRTTSLIGAVMDIVSNIRILKSFSLEDQYLATVLTNHREALAALQTASSIAGLSSAGSMLITGVGLAVLLLVATHMVGVHTLTPGQLTYLVSAGTVMMGSSETISQALASFDNLAISAERLEHTQRASIDQSGASVTPVRDGGYPLSVEFDSVSFSYQDEALVLKDLSFTVGIGGVLGIRGESGSGKSTLATLCNGLYRPTIGTIRIFGTSVEQWDLQALRRRVCIIFSDGNLLPDTVLRNICMDESNYDLARVRWAADQALADTFISALSDGYNHRIGHGGWGLSSGQRQRLALARAFWLKPELLILDEATSNLDLATESVILRNLIKSRANLATIIISHRRETLSGVTDLLVLDSSSPTTPTRTTSIV